MFGPSGTKTPGQDDSPLTHCSFFAKFVFKPLFFYVRYFCVQAFVLLCPLLLLFSLFCYEFPLVFTTFVSNPLFRYFKFNPGSLIPLLNIHEDDYYMEAQIVATLTHAV